MESSSSETSYQPRLWVVLLSGLVIYRLVRLGRDLFWTPLAAVPGPWSRASSRLPFAASIIRGDVVRDAVALHRKHGPIVRIAPNAVSVAAAEAYPQILCPDQRWLKDPDWWSDFPGTPPNVLNTIDPDIHRHIRRAIGPAFVPEPVREQEPTIQSFVDLLVRRLRDLVDHPSAKGAAVVNIVPWFNFTTFDIFGALFFSQSFECLRNSEYHPWIGLLYTYIKAGAFISAARLFPVAKFLLFKCLPPSARKAQQDHSMLIANRVAGRLAMNPGQTSDLMSHILRRSHVKDLPPPEFNSNFTIMTIAGSETSATVLSGMTHYLANNQDKLALLNDEIRSRFNSPDSITLDAIEHLPYLNAVISEGLRLCTPVTFMLPRVVPKGGELLCGKWLPEGTSVTIQAYVMCRDPQYFRDPESFIPERWLRVDQEGSEGGKIQVPLPPFANDRHQVSQAFGTGPRHCIGKYLAWTEMRLIMAKLVWEFDLLPLEDGKPAKALRWEDHPVFILVDKFPIEIRLRRRH